MFKKLKIYLEYKSIINSDNLYKPSKALEFFIKVNEQDIHLKKEQRYMLIFNICNSVGAIEDLLKKTDIIALDNAERIILINRLLQYDNSYIIYLLDIKFKFLPNELDLIVGNLIRTKDCETAKYFCQKGVLTIEHYNTLISLGVMNELTNL